MQVTTTIDGASLHVRIENDSDATVHIFDSARMPYFILDDVTCSSCSASTRLTRKSTTS